MTQNKAGKTVRQIGILDLMITVETITLQLLQINVIQAGTGIEQGVIKQKTFQMQYAQPFATFYRYTVKWNVTGGITGCKFLIHHMIAGLRPFANQSPLGAVKINKYLDIQLWAGLFGVIQCLHDFASGLIVLQIKCDQINPALGAGDQLQNTLFELAGLMQDLHGITIYG